MDEVKKEKEVKTKKATGDKPTEKEKALSEANESLIKEIEELKKSADDYKDKWMRNAAEFDNYKKRNAKLWQDAFNEGLSSAVNKILPIGDGLDRALCMELDEKTAEGIKGLKKKFLDSLGSMGIEEIDPVGKPFDPNEAEAVMQAEKEDGDTSDTVKAVFEKGYKINGKVIRYAKVSVVK